MIKVAFSIPKLHEFNIIFDEPTTDEIEHIRSSHPELSVDEFTQSEDDIIKLNFQYFCSVCIEHFDDLIYLFMYICFVEESFLYEIVETVRY